MTSSSGSGTMGGGGSSNKVIGQPWQFWPAYEDEGSGGGETSSSSSSSISTPSGMATPTHWSLEDVMKLPKKDMKIFGQSPIQDDFTLVVCDSCGKIVKIEAFEHHYRLRHDSNGVSLSGSSSSVRSKAKRPFRPCTVDLLKEDLLHSSISSSTSSSTSSSSAAHSTVTTRSSTPAAVTSAGPNLPTKEEPLAETVVVPAMAPTAAVPATPSTSLQSTACSPQIQQQHQQSVVVPVAVVPGPPSHVLHPPPPSGAVAGGTPSSSSLAAAIEVMDESSSSSFIQPTPMDESEEADSTTQSYSNVISIPDTDPLPHGMSNDLMAMVSGEISPSALSVKSDSTAVDSTSSVVAASAQAPPPPPPAATVVPSPSSIQINSPLINLQLNVPQQQQQQQLTQQAPQSVLQSAVAATSGGVVGNIATTPNGKKISPGKKGSAGGSSGGSGGKDPRKPQREYHPDRHCGVWDNDSKRHCTRALTCKSHSILLKRKIPGRSKAFDDLVAAHKANKEAMAIAAKLSSSSTPTLPNVAAAAGSMIPQPPLPNSTVESVLSSITTPNPALDPSRFQYPVPGMSNSTPNGMTRKPTWNLSAATGASPSLHLNQQQQLIVTTNGSGSKKAILSTGPGASSLFTKDSSTPDENLHYTTDHPKPLAVCTFGGRRLGGLLVADRSQFLTRKVVRVAITAGGFHRIRPQNRLNELKVKTNQPSLLMGNSNVLKRSIVGGTPARLLTATPTGQGGSYLVNYNFTPQQQQQQATLMKQRPNLTLATSLNIQPGQGPPRQVVGNVSMAVPNQINPHPVPPQVVVTPNMVNVVGTGLPTTTASASTAGVDAGVSAIQQQSFKTELQDFKGGIKFELGRNIKHILPSGNEVSK